MKKITYIFYIIAAIIVSFSLNSNATGISVDAGLTPAEDRWIIRTMFARMQRDDDPTVMNRKMEMYAFNAVLAYGLKRDLTLILKQPVLRREMHMMGSVRKGSGLSDLAFTFKYGLYRKNTREYTFGASAVLGWKFPTGDSTFTSETLDLKPGVYLSLRRGLWASDFNISYSWNGFADDGIMGVDPGNELALNLAVGYQFSLGNNANMSLIPVLEWSYKYVSPDRLRHQHIMNTGESIIFISPGIKFVKSSYIFEFLAQIPAWQDQEGLQLKQDINIIVGMRFMF